jgi:flagellar motor switch protein FliN/FliY
MNDIEKVGEPRRLDMLLDLPLDVSVELGRTRMSIQELLALAPGSVIELDKVAGEPLDILINDRLVARGEAVVVNDNIVSPQERITRLR